MIAGDNNVKQQTEYGCAVKCQQLILRDYGFEIDEIALTEMARNNGWFRDGEGVLMCDNGKLMGCFGVEYHHQQYNTIEDVVRELQQGHRVMVNVNPDKLHAEPEVHFRHNEASHAVIISKVDPTGGSLYFTDPMTGNVNQQCPLEWFRNAWQDSEFYMLATNEPACFQYDPSTQSMKELSNTSNKHNYVI